MIASALNGGLQPRLNADPPAITSVSVESINVVPNNQGDTWDPAWARDGTIYSPSDDGSGFKSHTPTNVQRTQWAKEGGVPIPAKTIIPD